MEFRPRDYKTENESHALPRARADAHPLSCPLPPLTQVNDAVVGGNADFYDPLRGGIDNDAKSTPLDPDNLSETSGDQPIKEWTSFRRLLMQRFPVSKMVSLSSMPDVLMRSGKSHDKSSTSMHLEELDDPKKFADEGVKVITWQEYVSRLHELKDEITRSWLADNRVTSLRLSIKVAKLMVDTSVSEFYSTLFVLVTDIMDMLGDLVWKRIKQKAEFTEDGALLCNLAGYLVTCVNDLKVILTQTLATNESNLGSFQNNKKLQISLMEPTIEYIMKCIFIGLSQRRVNDVLSELGLMKNQQNFGTVSCVSLVLHHLLKELPIEVVSSNVVHILHLIEFNNDNSFPQHLNYRLLGFRLYEGKCPVDIVNAVLDKVMQVIAAYKNLDEYLKVIDAYADLILQNQMDNHLDIILRGISERASNGVTIDEMSSLQSLLVKLLSHFECLEDVFCLNHFPEILDILHGKSQDAVFLHILNMATRSGRIRDPTSIQLLFEISRTLHDNMEFINAKNDDSQVARSVSRFVQMVDYGAEMEHHLAFLVDCRASFGRFNELKETLVHSSNSLAILSLQCAKKDLSFFKSCVTFSEVTIPSISGQRQFDLFLETAEVAFLGGLVSHVDGLIDSGISCLHILDRVDGFRTPADVEGLVSSIRKLCGFLIMVPGNISLPITYFPNNLFSLISSQSWFDPKMKTQIFSAILLLLTTLSQKTLPYHANTQIPGNDMLYYGDSSYKQELDSLSKVVLENLLCAVQQEPSQPARGSMALEACNCIASSFMQSNELSSICHTLIGTAKSCLNAQDRCLQSTIRHVNKQLPTLAGAMVSTSV
ncbi:uncharacterized protein LOC131634379 isoform X2 [Vicia villosa]|uniref:uncharacterized protein LOC131634379 isoform X2 n=1 Tax=Vicia villosa TaxID=3911 RepID=UPI00273AAD18|nr:uncharacterized protein LOC131634379 isoform X2 [Vicia villosa]